MSESRGGVQDTGNPVLDSTVNLIMSKPSYSLDEVHLRGVHKLMLELYEKEPKSEPRKRLTAEELRGSRG